MADHETDQNDDAERVDRRDPPPESDSVRILGAETAGDAVGSPDASEERREVHYSDRGPSWSAGSDPDTGDSPDLPHWSEPPTAEMAALGSEDPETGGSDLNDWASLSGSQPRFRTEDSDWADPDFGDAPDEPAGIAATRPEPTGFSDDEFAAAVSRRRGGSRRARSEPPPDAPAREDDQMEPAAGGRDLPTALATAGIVAVVALLAFNAGTLWTTLLVAVIIALASLEFCTGLREGGFRPAIPIALIASATLPLAAREYGISAMLVFGAVVILASCLWFLWEVTPGRPIGGVASTLLAYVYIGVLGGYAGLLLAATHGVGLVLGAVICVVAYDVVGFFVGSQFGRSPIAPRVSPNKTVEGTLAGMLAAVVLGALVVGQIHPWNTSKGLALGVLIAVAAFLGDIIESMLKRDLGIKDFGTLLPGHGGVLDRFDSMLFALPATFYLAVHLNIGF